jgi:hypothetical protein
MEGWLNLVKFLTSQFGLPGSLALALCGYLIWLLREERTAHGATRDKIDAINEKRIEASTQYLVAVRELKEALEAVTGLLGKK